MSDFIQRHKLATEPNQQSNKRNEEQLRAMANESLLSDIFVSDAILKYMLL